VPALDQTADLVDVQGYQTATHTYTYFRRPLATNGGPQVLPLFCLFFGFRPLSSFFVHVCHL
jgi:hypothetical protein